MALPGRANLVVSPQSAHAISIKRLLIGHQYKVFQHGLRNQHPVEGVAVRPWQRPRSLAVSKADRQTSKPLLCDRRFKVGDDGEMSHLTRSRLYGRVDRRSQARLSGPIGWRLRQVH